MMKNVMRRVYPMIGLEVEDKDLAKKMKNLDPSNTFDAGFLKDLADETRDVLGLDFVFCFIPSNDLTKVMILGFDAPVSDSTYQVFTDENKEPYIIAPIQ